MRSYYKSGPPYSGELYHHGILGQKWGIRRFQYEDGSYTPEGRKRYGLADDDYSREASRQKRIAKAKKVGAAVGSAAKKTGKAVGSAAAKAGKATGRRLGAIGRNVGSKVAGKAFKWAMTDEELMAYTHRLAIQADLKRVKASMPKSKGKEYLGELLREAGKKNLMNAIEEASMRRKDAMEIAKYKAKLDYEKELNDKYEAAKSKRAVDDYIGKQKFDTDNKLRYERGQQDLKRYYDNLDKQAEKEKHRRDMDYWSYLSGVAADTKPSYVNYDNVYDSVDDAYRRRRDYYNGSRAQYRNYKNGVKSLT